MRIFLLILVLLAGACGCPRVKPQPLPIGPVPPESSNLFTQIHGSPEPFSEEGRMVDLRRVK